MMLLLSRPLLLLRLDKGLDKGLSLSAALLPLLWLKRSRLKPCCRFDTAVGSAARIQGLREGGSGSRATINFMNASNFSQRA
jgi:hypothetical protein